MEMGRRVRTSLSPVLGSRRGLRSPALRTGRCGMLGVPPPGRRARSQSLTVFASGPGDAPGVLRRRLPPGRCPETYARARGADGARRSGFGRAGGPTPPGRGMGGVGRSFAGAVSAKRRRRRVYFPLPTLFLPQSVVLRPDSRPPPQHIPESSSRLCVPAGLPQQPHPSRVLPPWVL